jgi:glycosyltransferase involved in cell wall biosynthesis
MLARSWVAGSERGLLEIVVPEAFTSEHPDFTEWLDAQDASVVKLVPIALPEPLREGDMGLTDVLKQDLLQGRVLSKVLQDRQPERVLVMYLDHLQASLALRRLKHPASGRIPVSGIYFRPSFHYEGEPLLTRLRKRTLLSAMLANPAVHRVLCLDSFAVKAHGSEKLAWLPDGLDPAGFGESSAAIRERWGVPQGRKMVLFFGVVSARKGIHEVLAALPFVKTPITLIVAGPMPAAERDGISAAVQAASATTHIIHQDRYIQGEEGQDLMQAADVALVAYRRHIGSSHVLIRAAAAGTPVVGPEYGLMGKTISAHELGIAVDTSDPRALARELDRMLELAAQSNGGESPFDLNRAEEFAQMNHVDHFASTIFGAVLT